MKSQIKKIILGISLLLLNSLASASLVDLVVFSKDRPMQLYALLESCNTYVTGLDKISVIYCSTTPALDAAYAEVTATYPTAKFIKQSATPRKDFKKLAYKTVFESKTPYILFAVDDIVVIDAVDLKQCVTALEQHRAYAFYLRLGLDITECYMERRVTGLPVIVPVSADIYTWKFATGAGDWGYPHTVDMTLYRKRDIKKDFQELAYTTPNTLEGSWAGRAHTKRNLYGLCYKHSKIINMPLNLVQTDCNNRHTGALDVATLLEKFNQGFKIDVEALHMLPHKAPHVDHIPTLKAR